MAKKDAETKAHDQTDDMISEMEKHIKSIYQTAEKEMHEKWDKYMKNAEKRIEGLQKKYDDAVASGDNDAIKAAGEALGRAKNAALSTDKYYRDMVAEIAEQYTHANETAVKYINGQMADVYALNYNAVGKKINDETQGGYSYNLVDRRTVEGLMHDDKTLLPQKRVNADKDKRWNAKQINAQMLQGIIQGESIPDIAKRLGNVTDMTAAAAVRNARTMTTAAENRGRHDGRREAQEMGVIMQQQWMATHDARTRESHLAADGQIAEIDMPFVVGGWDLLYPGDPDAPGEEVYNCRCTTVTKVLGFGKIKTDNPEQSEPLSQQIEENVNINNIIIDPNKKMTQVMDLVRNQVSEYNEVGYNTEKLDPQQIADKISGADQTKGSCSSLAFCYLGNCAGYDVLDFRGGDSLDFFSMDSKIKMIMESAGGIIEKDHNALKAAAKILKENVVEGKMYYFSVGQHAAVVRKNGENYEYLELQSARRENTFYKLTTDELKKRFGAKKSSTFRGLKFDQSAFLIDGDILAENSDFKEMLGYINTKSDKQRKGAGGGEK